jgi:hypothetical protein
VWCGQRIYTADSVETITLRLKKKMIHRNGQTAQYLNLEHYFALYVTIKKVFHQKTLPEFDHADKNLTIHLITLEGIAKDIAYE